MEPTIKKGATAPTGTSPIPTRLQKKNSAHPRVAGFTLLELLVVLVIVAFIAASVVVSWSGIHYNAVQESAVSRIEALDQHMRTYARTHRTECALSFEIDTGRVRKLYHSRENQNPARETLGRGMRIEDLQATFERQQSRRIDVTFRQDGTSPTYGIRLAGPGEREKWLVFAGMSGQVTRLNSEREFHAALKSVISERRL